MMKIIIKYYQTNMANILNWSYSHPYAAYRPLFLNPILQMLNRIIVQIYVICQNYSL